MTMIRAVESSCRLGAARSTGERYRDDDYKAINVRRLRRGLWSWRQGAGGRRAGAGIAMKLAGLADISMTKSSMRQEFSA